jgi:hypothetical protein
MRPPPASPAAALAERPSVAERNSHSCAVPNPRDSSPPATRGRKAISHPKTCASLPTVAHAAASEPSRSRDRRTDSAAPMGRARDGPNDSIASLPAAGSQPRVRARRRRACSYQMHRYAVASTPRARRGSASGTARNPGCHPRAFSSPPPGSARRGYLEGERPSTPTALASGRAFSPAIRCCGDATHRDNESANARESIPPLAASCCNANLVNAAYLHGLKERRRSCSPPALGCELLHQLP